MGVPEEITEYLTNYNLKNKTILYWTFLDDEQREKLDKIAVESQKKYNKI